MTTAITCVDITESPPAIEPSTTNPNSDESESACFEQTANLYFTPAPGASIGVIVNNNNTESCAISSRKKMKLSHISTPPSVPLEVGANPNDSFEMGSIDVEVSELTAQDELCIQNIFDRRVPFVLVPRVRKESFSFDHDM